MGRAGLGKAVASGLAAPARLVVSPDLGRDAARETPHRGSVSADRTGGGGTRRPPQAMGGPIRQNGAEARTGGRHGLRRVLRTLRPVCRVIGEPAMKRIVPPVLTTLFATFLAGIATAQASGPPDLSATLPILDDRFEAGLSRYDGRRGVWSTQGRDGRLMTNAAETVFLDPGLPGGVTLPPVIVPTPGGLSLRTAALSRPALGAVQSWMRATGQGSLADDVRFGTGRITTAETWAQTYGYFEIEARVPRGRGRWPAFWMTFAGPGWPPEIDVMEAYGEGIAAPTPKDGTFNTAVFFDAFDAEDAPTRSVEIENPFDAENPLPDAKPRGDRQVYTFSRLIGARSDLDADIYGSVNTYAALWTPTEIVFYFAKGSGRGRAALREIYRTPTPEDAHDPMFVIANDQFTARGGWWEADEALDATLDPANDFLIRSIKIRALTPELTLDMGAGDAAFDPRSSMIRDTNRPDIVAPGAGFDVIALSGGADEVRLTRGRENKVIVGFGNTDRTVLEGYPFTDAADVLSRLTQVGQDVWLPSGADPYWPQTIVFRNRAVAQFSARQFDVRWPVGRDVWASRADRPNRAETDTDRDGVLQAAVEGGWLDDKGRATVLRGGPGPDRFMVSNRNSRVEEPETGGPDTLIAFVDTLLPPNVERGIARGQGGIRLTGGAGDDRLEAEADGVVLAGGDGDDLFIVAPGVTGVTVQIDATPGDDRLRGAQDGVGLTLAPELRAAGWTSEAVAEGTRVTFSPDQSLLIEGLAPVAAERLLAVR